MKYLSLIDITGCFHSICLSKESQLLTVSDSDLPMINRYVYKKLPMGTNFSKNIQNAALLHILSTINDILLYSDNIVVTSHSKESYFETVQKVFEWVENKSLKN